MRGSRTPADEQGAMLLETAGKTVLVVRLAALLLALVASVGTGSPAGPAVWGVLALALLNAALLLRWAALVPVLRHHPGLLALDVLSSLAALALPGSGAQLLYEAAGALLIGMVLPRAGAALLVTLLAGGQVLLATRPGVAGPGGPDLVALTTGVVLVFLLAGVGGAVRRGHDALLSSLAAVARRDAEAARATATSAERARLAREMHDGVAKSLFGLTLTATALARTTAEPGARTLARDLAGCATACGEQVRDLLGELRSAAPERPVARPAGAGGLDEVVRCWSGATGVVVRTRPADLGRAWGAADPACLATAAAVLREALDNVARHAGASLVDVDLSHAGAGDGGALVLTVHDDGAGFDASVPVPGRWGVVGMRERAAEAGGDLVVTTAPGTGTTVVLRLPSAVGTVRTVRTVRAVRAVRAGA